MRNCALGRVTQYSREAVIESRGCGVLGRPVKPGDDSLRNDVSYYCFANFSENSPFFTRPESPSVNFATASSP